MSVQESGAGPPDTLFFKAAKESLYNGVSLGRPVRCVGQLHPKSVDFIQECSGAELRPVVGSNLQIIRHCLRRSKPGRYSLIQCFAGSLGFGITTESKADTLAVTVIEDRKQACPAVPTAPNLRHVDAPKQVGVVHFDSTHVGPAGSVVPFDLDLKTVKLHEPLNPFAVNDNRISAEPQQRPDPTIPVVRETLGERFNPFYELQFILIWLTRLSIVNAT